MAQVSPDKDESMSDNESVDVEGWLQETVHSTADAQMFHVEGGKFHLAPLPSSQRGNP